MTDKRAKMMEFWTRRAKQYHSDPRANTNDIWLREVEIKCVTNVIALHQPKRILDFGCANGYSTIRLADAHPNIVIDGIDLNKDMIKIAHSISSDKNLKNLSFAAVDILQMEIKQKYDLIYSIRVFQNIENEETQKRVFNKLYTCLQPGGLFYFIESYKQGYQELNKDRQALGLSPLPIHPHLTLLTDEFDNYVAKRMKLLEQSYPSSSYYLMTRLLYSYIAKMSNEAIDYDHPIHQAAAIMPQIGEYGPQRAALYKKK
jgi:ubiquinone/menaquinone biosynthesis C-methylase UbiE